MKKKPHRKSPLRKRRDKKAVKEITSLEERESLDELIEVLLENNQKDDPDGWFSIPWRDGWNAVTLASCLSGNELDSPEDSFWLSELISKQVVSQLDYWRADEIIRKTDRPMVCAAMRCLQVKISKSDGGGQIYNDIFCSALRDKRLLYFKSSEWTTELILEFRCRDAIGTTAKMHNNKQDRQRRAFKAAWQRGLYQAAYSIKPVK